MSNVDAFTAVGVVGFLMYLIPYGMLQMGRLDGNGVFYCASNVFAATLVLISLVDQFNLASALTQTTWIMFGVVGMALRFARAQTGLSQNNAPDGYVQDFQAASPPPAMTIDWLEHEAALLDRIRRGEIARPELDLAANEIGARACAGSIEHGRLLVTVLDASPILRATIMAIVLNADDADDAMQETLLAVSRSLPSFRGESPLVGWATGIARNKAKDVLRRRGRPAAPDPHGSLPTEQERFTSQWATHADVERAMATLSPKLRTVFELADIEGLTYREIAQKLNIERNTVASRLRRARAELQLIVAVSAVE